MRGVKYVDMEGAIGNPKKVFYYEDTEKFKSVLDEYRYGQLVELSGREFANAIKDIKTIIYNT